MLRSPRLQANVAPKPARARGERACGLDSGGDPGAKRRAWATAWRGVLGSETFRTGDWRAFEGRMQTFHFGTGRIHRIHALQPWQWMITPATLERSSAGPLVLLLCLRGSAEIRLEAAPTVRIGARESVVLDTRRVWRLNTLGATDCLSVVLDRADADADLITTGDGTPVVLDRTTMPAVLLHTLLMRTFDALALQQVPPREARNLQAQLSRLAAEALSATTGGQAPVTAHVASMMRRARLLVARRASDPGFRPSGLARELGITPRYLTTLFQLQGYTPGDFIRQIRLHIAWDRLTDPEDNTPIKVIARDCGVSDAAQFSTVVTRAFGRSPREIRRVARAMSTSLS